MASVMAAFPAGQAGAAGGLTFLARTLGLVTGVAVLAAVFGGRRGAVGFQPAFAEAFTLAALAVAGAAVAGLPAGPAADYHPRRGDRCAPPARPGRRPARANHSPRAA